MKIFAVAVLVVVAGVSQAMGDCVDTLPADLACDFTCEALAASDNCNVAWNTCAPSVKTVAVSTYCQKSCGICTPVVVAPAPAPAIVCTPYSKEACEYVADNLGLAKGGAGYDMVGDYNTKGCYTYKTGKYANMVFYGKCEKDFFSSAWNWLGGDSDAFDSCKKQMETIPSDGNQYRPNGYDCSVGCHPYSEDACRNAVAGLALGGKGYGFVGSYGNKGCYAYSSGKYSGMAYYSTGGNNADMAKPLSGAMYRPAGYDCN